MPVGIPVQTITTQSLQGKSVSPHRSCPLLCPSLSSDCQGLGQCAFQLRYICTVCKSHPGIPHLGSTCLLIWVYLDFFERTYFHSTTFPYPLPLSVLHFPATRHCDRIFRHRFRQNSYVFQVLGFRVCSLWELLRFASH